MTISLVLGSFSFAFAHPTTADTFADAITSGWTYDNSGLGSPYGKDMTSSWYQIFGKNSLSMLRDIRYQLTGTDYDNHNGNSIYTYFNNIYSTLTNTGSGSILYGINQTNTKLSDIYTSIGVGGSGNNVLSKLSAIINAVGDISITDLTSYVSSIDTSVSTINTDGVKLTGNALNRLNQIAGYTSWISTIRDTISRIEGINTTISAISSDINSKLSSFKDDYNNIVWSTGGYNFTGFKSKLTDSSYLSTSSTLNSGYILFSMNYTNSSRIIKIHCPVRNYNINDGIKLEFGYYLNGVEMNIPSGIIAIEKSNSYTDFLINPIGLFNNTASEYFVKVSTNTNSINFNPSLETTITYLDSDKLDYYTLDNYISNFNIINLMRQAKEIFFDDDTLQAKKNNASQTSAVLTGFTGSGQASATANDYGTLSNGVNNVKGGMNTNVSASSAFGIFNNESGYSFWSAETLQELNSSGSNTRNLSKSNDDDWYVYYNSRLEYLLNAMNGGDKK